MFQIVVIKRFRLIFAECLNKNFKKRLRVYFSFMNTFTYRSILSLNSFFFFFHLEFTKFINILFKIFKVFRWNGSSIFMIFKNVERSIDSKFYFVFFCVMHETRNKLHFLWIFIQNSLKDKSDVGKIICINEEFQFEANCFIDLERECAHKMLFTRE